MQDQPQEANFKRIKANISREEIHQHEQDGSNAVGPKLQNQAKKICQRAPIPL